LTQRERDSVLARSFRDLERRFNEDRGRDLSLTGVTAGTVEEARVLANAVNQGNNGLEGIQQRVLDVVRQQREIQEQQLAEERAIAAAIRAQPRLLVAPVGAD
jgi:hypothetical protein